jgi:hypothetical protein
VKTYEVGVVKTRTLRFLVQVEAENETEAEAQALRLARAACHPSQWEWDDDGPDAEVATCARVADVEDMPF